MRTQIIQDHNGVPTGVFIPMRDWEEIKAKYPNISEENLEEFVLSDEQKKLLDAQEFLNESEYQDSDEFIKELKKEYAL
ncbi:MAG: addiction module component CHP02574 family protein [Flavobacteriaceae bacterium]|nr:addiction module component CHP02574 family protein [Flavobacteriaceae bacterium]